MNPREQRRLQLEKLAQDADGRRRLEVAYRTSFLKDEDSAIITVTPVAMSVGVMIDRILDIEFPERA